MIKSGARIWLLAAALLCGGKAQAEDKEPFAEVEIGGAGEWSLRGGGISFGPAIAVEVTPLKDLLEIEAGVAPLFGGGRTEWNTDLLFKKPFTLSDTVELMIGAGPEWTYTAGGGGKIGGEAALDFQFWPWRERRFGWFLEPSYSYSFGGGHEQSLGVSVGLLIAIP
jgi:hypothetical protein